MPEATKEVYSEKHYRVVELAKLWNVSRDTVRRLFNDEPGVLILSRKRQCCRRYATLLIPESVARRVHLRLSIPPASILNQSPVRSVPQRQPSLGSSPLNSHTTEGSSGNEI